ncbi:hypothetical protein B0H14DRAFT_3635738 [Mycena olivaceomarginata]|nr:hypothetical protein B0H14DRAFT_3635738 [Mycena olivaceomarginata]
MAEKHRYEAALALEVLRSRPTRKSLEHPSGKPYAFHSVMSPIRLRHTSHLVSVPSSASRYTILSTAPKSTPRMTIREMYRSRSLQSRFFICVTLSLSRWPFFLAVWRAGHTDLHYPCVKDFLAKKKGKDDEIAYTNQRIQVDADFFSIITDHCRTGPVRRARDLPLSRGEAPADLEVVQLDATVTFSDVCKRYRNSFEIQPWDGQAINVQSGCSLGRLSSHINLAIDEWKGENGVVDLQSQFRREVKQKTLSGLERHGRGRKTSCELKQAWEGKLGLDGTI